MERNMGREEEEKEKSISNFFKVFFSHIPFFVPKSFVCLIQIFSHRRFPEMELLDLII